MNSQYPWLIEPVSGDSVASSRGWPPRRIALAAWFAGIIGLALVSLAGCVVPARCCGPCVMGPPSCPPSCPPVKIYAETMHPIVQEDGRRELMPHAAFRAWIRGDDASRP